MAGLSAAILGCDGPRLTPRERAFFAEAQPWGFILFARNLQTPDQVRRLTSALRDAVGRDAPVLIDQEGGRVQRMGPPHWRQWLPPLDQMARAGDDAPRAMELRYRLIAEELRAVGIDVNCAPCCDLAEPDTHPVLRNRCYGTDPDTVTAAARAVAKGLRAGGVLPVLKHMPGHGRALVDSHLSLPVVTAAAETLRAHDFAPFAALADLPMAMTAHIVYTALDPDRPATASPTVLRLIREELGFSGLLMTDDISMEALSGDLATRSAAALKAGCDLVLHCTGHLDEMERVVGAAGRLSGTAMLRAEAALAVRSAPAPIDIAAAEAELEALLNGRVHG
ncbi:beta-N-acetylhexosaminidase [Psychromarinibacter sp. C21-152]|uniref:beta-N-acetylhexosaminidase n=1 Tax=Psychromarinibacter sediminicola TaxID=3033385 RepID=A0AAE3NTH7_9RHOB|nr:beta-N-acetylhexosaminidase [Psychromarinibacter sediminicola]MDF0601364.1 beta-N-acetylhexosaminidase [Psychromarinibacter sediminicola]